MDMPTAIGLVIEGKDLNTDQMTQVMQLIMTGEATPAQIGGFLVGLRIKSETVSEITGAARVMRNLAAPVTVDTEGLLDTCGTGGSGINKFNVSTASAMVAAAAGVRVAKHGNRAATSKSGSADLLEAAGAVVTLTPDQVGRCIEQVGVGFLFAQTHHSAMKHAIGPRREMLVRTIFNMLGPLTNPAGAKRQLLGVYAAELVRPIAEVLAELGSEHVLVVHSSDGLDELSISDSTHVAELKEGSVQEYDVAPEDFELKRASLDDLRVNNPEESFELVKGALDGSHESASNMVALNAGAAIYASGQALSMGDGVAMAQDAIASGLATEKLKEFAEFTQQIADE